jgi:hypothetical protein
MLKGFTRWLLAWFLVWFLAAVILLCLSLGIRVAAATGKAGSTPVTDPRPDMVTALQATGPHPSLGCEPTGTRRGENEELRSDHLRLHAAPRER